MDVDGRGSRGSRIACYRVSRQDAGVVEVQLVWRSAGLQSLRDSDSRHNNFLASLSLTTSFHPPFSAMVDITQSLPPELFIKILCHVSILDVLRLKQVKRLSLWWAASLSAFHIYRLIVSSSISVDPGQDRPVCGRTGTQHDGGSRSRQKSKSFSSTQHKSGFIAPD